MHRLSFPTNLAFEPVQLCNAACFCCPYTWLKEDKAYLNKTMSRDAIQHLLMDFSSCRNRYGYEGKLRINPFRFSDPLVCKDLEFILELCKKYRISCHITTNAVSFRTNNVELLNDYFEVIRKISISVIGSSSNEVKELMNVDLDHTFKMLDAAVSRAPRLRKKISVNLRRLFGTPDEEYRLNELSDRFESILKRKPNLRDIGWMSNRINGDIVRTHSTVDFSPRQTPELQQSKEEFVTGCPKNILERMEVMCDGSVVLCCDDAEKNKSFGNVFDEGIDQIWNGQLLEEHKLIFRPNFGQDKNNLICGTCSRALWSHGHSGKSADID